MPDNRTLIGYVPPKIGLGIVVLAAVFVRFGASKLTSLSRANRPEGHYLPV